MFLKRGKRRKMAKKEKDEKCKFSHKGYCTLTFGGDEALFCGGESEKEDCPLWRK
jgi:hypothetical protein